jgi:uncharacterized protein (TIGR02594 family)
MRFKKKLMLTAGCICLIGLAVPAASAPKPKGVTQHSQSAQVSAKKNKVAQRVLKVHANARRAREARASRLVSMPIAETPKRPLLGWPALVSEARKYLGTNPTARSRLWCATFMNMVLAKTGYSGTNSDAAKSFAQYGRRVSDPQVGAIAVLTRGKNGGHVGVVSGIDEQGNPIIISGNHGHRVGEAIYPRSRVIAYVMPSGGSGPANIQLAARSQTGERGQASERRAPSDGSIDSPITELIAAIEAEQKRDERPTRVASQPSRSGEQRPAMQAPEPAPRPVQRAGTLPLDPALAELLGSAPPSRARVQAPSLAPQATPQTAPPQRQRQVQQQAQLSPQPARVAAVVSVGVNGLR